MGDVWNTFKRHVKQFEFLSESKSQEDSFVAHLDCPPANSSLSHSFHFGAFKIDQHLTSICHPPSPPTSLSPLPEESWWEHQLNTGVFFSMLDAESLYLLLFSSIRNGCYALVKGHSTISPLKCQMSWLLKSISVS